MCHLYPYNNVKLLRKFFFTLNITIPLFCTISSYLTLNNIVTLKSGLKVDSRSLKLVPFESLSAVSYSLSAVTLAVYVAVCEIFSVK